MHTTYIHTYEDVKYIKQYIRLCRFTEDIYQMTGYRPGLYWQWTWRYIGPVIMSCIFVSSIICMAIDKPKYNAYKKEEVRPPPIRSFLQCNQCQVIYISNRYSFHFISIIIAPKSLKRCQRLIQVG